MLPTHYKKTGASSRVLRITEKYVLAIALVAFCLVFLGAFYLPERDVLSRNARDLDNIFVPPVSNPHGHGDEDHRKSWAGGKNKGSHDLHQELTVLNNQLEKNKQKLSLLEERLEKIRAGKSNEGEAGNSEEEPEEAPDVDDDMGLF